MPEPRPLNLFLCHASQDKPAVQALCNRLKAENWLAPWLDKEQLLPGQDWDLEIYKAIRKADAIIVCLSRESVAKEGYVQKEFKRALSLAEEKPEGTIYIIPLRLDNCTPPQKFQPYQWLDYFASDAHEKLLQSLRLRAESLGILPVVPPVPAVQPPPASAVSLAASSQLKVLSPDVASAAGYASADLDLYKFIEITPPDRTPFWIAKYPVTNAQYQRFLDADDFSLPEYWSDFLKYAENYRTTVQNKI